MVSVIGNDVFGIGSDLEIVKFKSIIIDEKKEVFLEKDILLIEVVIKINNLD